MFHASAQSIYHRVLRGASKKEKRALFLNTASIEPMFADRHPQLVLYGDIHKPYFQMVSSKQGEGMAVWNIGSVGLPYDGVPLACYAIVEGQPGSAPAPLGVQLIRVPYDTEEAVRIAAEADLPELNRYKYEVRTGREKS
jgi:protein phosphatase